MSAAAPGWHVQTNLGEAAASTAKTCLPARTLTGAAPCSGPTMPP